MMTIDDLKCPSCKGSKLARYGKTAAGLQKYRCLEASCRRQFVAGSDYLIDQDVKDLVLRLLAQGVDPPKIHEALNPAGAADEARKKISLRWIYQLKRKMGPNDRPR
jgi:transposase-like protein